MSLTGAHRRTGSLIVVDDNSHIDVTRETGFGPHRHRKSTHERPADMQRIQVAGDFAQRSLDAIHGVLADRWPG